MPLGPDELVALARVTRPVGVKGDLRVEPLADRPLRLESGRRVWLVIPERRAGFTVAAVKGDKTRPILSLQELCDRTVAETWRGALVMVLRRDLPALPAGEYYDFDIVGLEARSSDGQRLGVVTEVMHLPANDVYVIRRDGGGEILLPAVHAVVNKIDVAGGYMVVSPWPEWDDDRAH